MGRSPYLVEIRTGGETKQYVREIMHDVADRFGVRGAVKNRPVPHITLFGPYNTNAGPKAKAIVGDVCADYDTVPYRLDGFNHFGDHVIYIDVVPSPELRQLRRDLSRRLRGISYNHRGRDENRYHAFHVTVAFRDIRGQFDEIWDYLNDTYSPDIDEYATRITSLRNREMLHEYDLLQDEFLSPSKATSRESWEETTRLLEKQQLPTDHERCERLSLPLRMYAGVEDWLRG